MSNRKKDKDKLKKYRKQLEESVKGRIADERLQREIADEVEILLVDANLNDVALTLRALNKYNIANKVHVVRDGAEALDFVFGTGAHAERDITNKPKMILLELKLPKVDGLEVLRKIKSDERTKAIHVVVLTSSTDDRDIVESYELGVNDYVIKPLDFDKFIQAVSELGLYWLLLNQSPR